MGKYGSGITFGQACMMEKEELKQAVYNKAIDCYDDNGKPVYKTITKEEALEIILSIYDEAVYQGIEAMTAGRVLGRMYKEDTGNEPDLNRYMQYRMEESAKYNDYSYESDKEFEKEDRKNIFKVIKGGKDNG